MREGYKDTPLGEIPESWGVVVASKIAEITSSKRIHQSEYVEEGIPFYRSKEIILKSKGKTLDNIVFITTERFEELTERFGAPQEGDILITAVGTIGTTYLIGKNEKFYFKDGNLMWLRHINNDINKIYLKYFFSSFFFQNLIDKTIGGSSQKALTIEKFSRLHIILPPINEQKKIANILSTVDEKIDVISEQIENTRKLKKGLMQRLLTRGIGHTRFKPSPLGEIPESWEVVKIVNIIKEGRLGGNYKNSEDENGLPLIKMGNLGRGCIVLNKLEYIPGSSKYLKEDILNKGDLLFNTRNTLELVGKVAVWRKELDKALYNSNLMRISFNPMKVSSNYFMNYVFNSSYGLTQLRRIATGTTSVAAIYTKDLLKIKIILPSLPEQRIIDNILTSVDDKIDSLSDKKKEYEQLKKGLMQKLLTGKIRVRL
ncbi:MAG: restriction endonuclease subunit S [Bacteroidales bacterium]|nr:restriction endonuclease subunit S [Bacteroidales bacterium]